ALLARKLDQHGWQRELLDREDLAGDRPAHQRDAAELLEGVHAEAPRTGPLVAVGEVDLVLVLELGAAVRVLEHLPEGTLGVGGLERRDIRYGLELAVHADERRRSVLEVEVRASPLRHAVERGAEVEVDLHARV